MNLCTRFLFVCCLIECFPFGCSAMWKIIEEDDSPMVDIPNLGRVRGRTGKSRFKGRTIYEFLGINYAKPPSGDRRFKPPEEFERWDSVYDARKLRQKCPQINMEYYPDPDSSLLDEKEDAEDCLVVNVFTPKVEQGNKTMPVLFYVHGGSFYLGSAYDFFPEFLLEEDLVLVVIQYRLGPLGFMSLHLDDVPGNMAMLDILMALRWVKDHIQHFGGDPRKITVFGQSAGGAAVSALLASPLVKEGLFEKVIMHSGSVLAPWAVDADPVRSAKLVATHAGCPTDIISEMITCLRKAKAKDIVAAHAKAMVADIESGGKGMICSSFVVQAPGKDKFLVKHPADSFAEGRILRVPAMGGIVRDEGSYFFGALYQQWKLLNHTDMDYLQRNMTRDLIRNFGYDDPYGVLTDFYHNTYFIGGRSQELTEMLPGFIDISGVLLMKEPTYNVLRSISYSKDAYAFSFNFYGNISKLRASSPNWDKEYPFPSGVAHSDELGYLFPSSRSNYTERELKMVHTMTKLWTNFVIHGSPFTEKDKMKWPKLSTPFGPYLRITDQLRIRDNFFDEFTISSREGYLPSSSESANCYVPFVVLFSLSAFLFF